MPSQWHKEDGQIEDRTTHQGEMMPEKKKNDPPE
jgi:hypothetical protein